jgi:Protein of unknown function (DUF2924)
MELNITHELARLRRLTPRELLARYAEVFGETPNTANKVWLLRRIAWRLQARAEGDLSERARQRAAEIADDADLRTTPPRDRSAAEERRDAEETSRTATLRFQPDDRLPPPGTVLTRNYKGETLQVKVLADGFEYDGRVFSSLSGVAKAITGSHCNGYLFFRVGNKGVGE